MHRCVWEGNQQTFHCVWSRDNALSYSPIPSTSSTHTHTHTHTPLFALLPLFSLLLHSFPQITWQMGYPQVLLERTPPQLPLSFAAWEWGRHYYCSQLLVSTWTPPPPSSPAQQETVPPDDWESSHNHSPGSRSWHAAAKWIKQVVDIVCWALRTGVSQSRDQDKVGVELLTALISNNATGYEFWAQICRCVWHCVWPTAGMWLPPE